MKKIILTIVLSSSLYLYGQKEYSYNEVSNGTEKGLCHVYNTKQGQSFKIGDTITIGKPFEPSKFTYLFYNLGTSYQAMLPNAMGIKVVIKRMKATRKQMFFYTTPPTGSIYALLMGGVDAAIDAGEIELDIMTKEKALNILKEWKTKLDLELISQEEYDAKKEELIKYLK